MSDDAEFNWSTVYAKHLERVKATPSTAHWISSGGGPEGEAQARTQRDYDRFCAPARAAERAARREERRERARAYYGLDRHD